VLGPVSHDQLAGILGGVAYGVGSAGAEHIAEPIGDLDLTIAAQESAIVFRLAVQHDAVVGVVLIERDQHTRAVFLQILGDFHRLIVRVNGRLRAPGPPVSSASS